MNSVNQIISFIVSFLYGFIFFLLTKVNFYLTEQLKNIIKNIITVIFVLDMIFLYILILYKINGGYFHIYFIVTVVFGYIISFGFYKKFFSKINVKHIFKH